jgi:hypothetical protein
MLTEWTLTRVKVIYQKKERFEKAFEAMEGFCFAVFKAGLNGSNTRKKGDNDSVVYKDKGWTASVRTVLKRMHCTSC